MTWHRTPKYRAKRTEVNGISFHSKKEADRYLELVLSQRQGWISDLELQPRFSLEVNGVKICKYVADFRYRTKEGKVVVEDVKGFKTREYRIKSKLMLACHGIEILET